MKVGDIMTEQNEINKLKMQYQAIDVTLKLTAEICKNSGKWENDQQAYNAKAFLIKLKQNLADSILDCV